VDVTADLDHLGPDFFDFAVDVGGRPFVDAGPGFGYPKNSKQ